MFFKSLSDKSNFKTIIQALLLGISVITLSCSRFLNEKKQADESISLSNQKLVCLNTLPDIMLNYSRGTANQAAIRSGFECTENALSYFNSKTRGSLPNAYTLTDLRNFFGKYFLKQNNVSPAFGAELFKVKKVLIGGDDQVLTKDEISKLITLLDVVKEQAVTLEPSVPVLLLQKKTSTESEIDAAAKQLNLTLWALFRQVDLYNSDYSFDDLKKFLEGWNDFIHAQKSEAFSQSLDENIPVIEAVKNVLIGEHMHFTGAADWHAALDSVVGLYSLGLKYHYVISAGAFGTPKEMQQSMDFVDAGFALISQSLPMTQQQQIPFADIDNLLQKFEARKFLPKNFTAAALMSTYKTVVLRTLDPQRGNDARGLSSLQKIHWLALQEEWNIYKTYQIFIDGLTYDKGAQIGFADLAKAWNAYPVQTAAQALGLTDLDLTVVKNAWQDGQGLLLRPYPVLFSSTGKQIIEEQANQDRTTWASLTKWNLMRTLTRFLMLGYASNNPAVDMSHAQILQDGLVQWYTDFRPIGLELKAFDPRSINSGASSFQEANFFMYSGDGKAVMSWNESFEFVSILFAGGTSAAENIREDMVAKGCGLPQNDVFGYPFLAEACYKNNLRLHYAEYFDNLPGLVKELHGLNETQWNEFYASLKAAAVNSFSPPAGRVETADLRTEVMLLHYAETLLVVYDADRDNALSFDEVKTASPRFFDFIQKQSPLKQAVFVNDFFAFLVFKGTKPSVSDLGLYAGFQGEKLFRSLGEANRGNILKVFEVLKNGTPQ